MQILKGNAIVGQSGGPTAAINATLSGVINGALDAKKDGIIENLYGMRNGIEGFLQENLINLTEIFRDGKDLNTLATTPSSALGSCRFKLKDCETDITCYDRLLRLFQKYGIRYFFYIGGNDSMDTVANLSRYFADNDYEIRIIGVPKTVDNDLVATDHTPGFASAAKFVAVTVKEIIRDISVYNIKSVTVIETMGRDAGWLAAAAALTKLSGGVSPDLIYLPERVFDENAFIASVNEAFKKHTALLVVASEGIRWSNGSYVGAGRIASDAFGHSSLSGAGRVLANLVKERIGCKTRAVELNISQRCSGHILSKTDIDESVSVGENAVKLAVSGVSGAMVTIERLPGKEYSVAIGHTDVTSVANKVRNVPDEYINVAGNGITDAGIEYLRPLIAGEVAVEYENGLPRHIVI